MKTLVHSLIRLAGAAILASALLAGCQREQSSGRDAGGITFSDGSSITLKAKDYPNATITHDGRLLIDGKPLQLDAAQQQRVMEYRAKLKDIAEQGISIGKQGAALGIQAATEALQGIADGEPERIGDRIQTQADKVRLEAQKICDHLVNLRTAQDALVSQVPAFAPYADVNDEVIGDCRR
jgi:hypothetical protein